MKTKNIIIAAVVFLPFSGIAIAQTLTVENYLYWELNSSTKEKLRWVEIHKVDSTPDLFHVDVLERKRSKNWQPIKHLSAHMAVSRGALEKSLKGPLKPGEPVYPESFGSALHQWQQSETRNVCVTSIDECLSNKQ